VGAVARRSVGSFSYEKRLKNGGAVVCEVRVFPLEVRRIVGDKVMMPADLKRLHKYMLEVEHIVIISDEMREVVESEWPELAHKLPPKGDAH
jgi:hypothetical protein